jgi:hypothetical protein
MFEFITQWQIGGIPVIPVAIFGVIVWYIATHVKPEKKFIRKELREEVKKYNDIDFEGVAVPSGKKLCYGYHDVGHRISYVLYKAKPQIVKNKKGKLVVQLSDKDAKVHGLEKAIKSRHDRIDAMQRMTLSEDEITKEAEIKDRDEKIKSLEESIREYEKELTIAKADAANQKQELIYCFKVRGTGIMSQVLAYFNFGLRYYLVDKDFVTQSAGEVIINPTAEHTNFLGVIIFSSKAREIVENIAFKINRENELEALINFLPKMEYLETSIAGQVAKLREKAEIEANKYKSQTEGGSDTA